MKPSRIHLAVLFLLLAAPAFAAPDLGVRFISRSPLYWRYNVTYPDGVPQLAPTHDGKDPNLDRHWPAPGEKVTFTAHVRNQGDSGVQGFDYRWYVDGQPQSRMDLAYGKPLAPGQEAAVSLSWRWPTDLADHTVKIVIDPASRTGDRLRRNNTYEDHTNALSFSIWVEKGLYDRFNAKVNGFGTRSFEDWFRWQFDAMKQDFARSIYPGIAPNGILERIRVEEINVIPFDPNNLGNWRQVLDADPHIFLNDGRWQFTSEAATLADKKKDWDQYVSTFVTTIDWGLIHELSHQLGAIDEYRMNVDQPSQNPVSHTRHDFHRPGLMGGGYVADGYDGTYYDSHTAGFLSLNLHFRRGFYGDFLFDTPRRTFLRLLDVNGAPLADADVNFYQKDLATETIPSSPHVQRPDRRRRPRRPPQPAGPRHHDRHRPHAASEPVRTDQRGRPERHDADRDREAGPVGLPLAGADPAQRGVLERGPAERDDRDAHEPVPLTGGLSGARGAAPAGHGQQQPRAGRERRRRRHRGPREDLGPQSAGCRAVVAGGSGRRAADRQGGGLLLRRQSP